MEILFILHVSDIAIYNSTEYELFKTDIVILN